ncbi:GtrA family protein [Solwaraspora sp. WMMD406]|uniref:GtrA family protein n=1 Tax=Solwaraspora sp. WMMD406 TaxID=3016095 RepID=UPI00241717CF|nr:GtrA family protein [Solwaraspora sp. WMMD406]MDG4767854.1 GtrA family protein [Solwaraspora sp. WMMD406]
MPASATGDPSATATSEGLVRRLRDRFGQLIHEFGKFGVVGGIAFVIDIALFNVAASVFDLGPLTAKTLSTVVAASFAFVGNRFWTWRHRARSGLAREYGLYFFFNAVGLGIGLACLAISHYGLGSIWPTVFRTLLADNIAANVIGVMLGTLFRFWSYRRFVFIAAAPAAVAAATAEGD